MNKRRRHAARVNTNNVNAHAKHKYNGFTRNQHAIPSNTPAANANGSATVTVVLTIVEDTGLLQGEPRIVARGVRGLSANGFGPQSNRLMSDAKRVVTASIAGASRQTLADESLLKEHVRVELKRFIQKQTGARPVIMPVIVLV